MLAAAALLVPPALAAQQGWTVEAAAGRAEHDPVAAKISTTQVSAGLSYDGGPRWLYLSAGAPYSGPGPSWAAAGAGAWLSRTVRGVEAGVAAAGHGWGYTASGEVEAGGGATVELLPTAVLRYGPVRAELASGFVGVLDAAGDSSESRGFHDSSARLVAAPAAGVEVAGLARWLRGDGGDWPYLGASVGVERPLGKAWASYRQEPVDPLYGSLPRRTWSITVSRPLGRAAAVVRPPPVPEIAGTRVTFRLPRGDHAQAPALLGDFNGWQPVPMAEEGEFWAATVTVAPGVHHYAFRTADGALLVPDHLPRVDDGFGGASAVLVVP
jgi:hypothetical protein